MEVNLLFLGASEMSEPEDKIMLGDEISDYWFIYIQLNKSEEYNYKFEVMEFSTSVEYAHATMNLPTLKTMKKKSSL